MEDTKIEKHLINVFKKCEIDEEEELNEEEDKLKILTEKIDEIKNKKIYMCNCICDNNKSCLCDFGDIEIELSLCEFTFLSNCRCNVTLHSKSVMKNHTILFKKKKRPLRLFYLLSQEKTFDEEIDLFFITPTKDIHPEIVFPNEKISFYIVDDISYSKYGMEFKFHYLM